LFTLDGQLVASRTCAYPTQFFNGNWAEQSPDDWWRAVCTSTQQLLAGIDPGEIACVALSGQMMGCTPVDRHGRALRPSILYCDQRAEAQTRRILERIDLADFYKIVGHRASPSYSLEKLMWVKDNEPDVYRQTFKSLCAKDYINLRLTGQWATDYSDASGTNAFDLNTFGWSERILDLARHGPRASRRARRWRSAAATGAAPAWAWARSSPGRPTTISARRAGSR
jgi:xylulokinase